MNGELGSEFGELQLKVAEIGVQVDSVSYRCKDNTEALAVLAKRVTSLERQRNVLFFIVALLLGYVITTVIMMALKVIG